MSFHTVIIDHELKPIEVEFHSVQPESLVEKYWVSKVEENQDLLHRLSQKYSSLYTITNGPYTEISSNPILETFIRAYEQHHDIVLSPDDMWMLVCLKFADFINNNAEQLRSIFVEHIEGTMSLTMGDLKTKHQWDQFFDGMKVKIANHVKNDVCHILTADFTTTGKVESILSTACIMHTFKPYFWLRRTMRLCGIRQVHFMGTLNDWQSLYVKTQELQSFSNDQFSKYIDGVLPIFDEFIKTYQGNVNKEFWIKVCDIKRNSNFICGEGVSNESITGWVSQLFGFEANNVHDLAQIKLPNIRVPVELENETTGEITQCYIVGGFHGIYSTENRHKPVMSLSVIEEKDIMNDKKRKGCCTLM